MKTILCFGDSNTRGVKPGALPGAFDRHPRSVRWTGIMQERLGAGCYVVEEGLSGRTSAFNDPLRPGRNAEELLPILLETHAPIDLLILMLGTNEMKAHLDLSAATAARGIAALAEFTKTRFPACAEILIVSPPHIVPTANDEKAKLFSGAVSKSRELAEHLRSLSADLGLHFFDAAIVAHFSAVDGIHLDESEHRALGEALAEETARILYAHR